MARLALKLIVGLGNPGPEHADTRHNAGFWCVDRMAARIGASFRSQARYQGEVAKGVLGGREVCLLKPMTYMNRSGSAVQAMVEYFRIAPEEVLVVHDELDLPVGTLRLKLGGGAGGHNGLKDLISHLGDRFWRMRVGIGHPGNRHEVIDFVLHRASRPEQAVLDEAIDVAIESIGRLPVEGSEKVMNTLHRRVPASQGE